MSKTTRQGAAAAPARAPRPAAAPASPVPQLRALLERAGHFPRPQGMRGRYPGRFIEVNAIPEGMHEVDIIHHGGRHETRIGHVEADHALPPGSRIADVRRSPIDERRDAVRDLRAELEAAVAPLLCSGQLPGPCAWQQLLADDLLDDVSVGAAWATIAPAPESRPVTLADLGERESAALRLLSRAPDGRMRTHGLKSRGVDKRAITRLQDRGLIEPCGTGKSGRGVYTLTSKGRELARSLNGQP